MYIGALSFFVTLMVKDPTGTHVNFDANFSQREYQIHFQPLTAAEYQTAFFLFRGIELSSMACLTLGVVGRPLLSY